MTEPKKLQRLIRFARKPLREQLRSVRHHLIERGWKYPHLGNDRTTYVIGLFGSGRLYIVELILQHIGERAEYFRDYIRFPPGPTSMIYSGHATIRHASHFQLAPAMTSRILEAVRSRFADLVVVYRHPLDSLLTNWVWWRTYNRDNRMISGISQVYRTTDDLCADLEQNFLEFKAFAEGDPDFFTAVPGPRRSNVPIPTRSVLPNPPPKPVRFLSFPEFVEESELYFQSATLTLRLEDFMIDPVKEFCKIAQLMSVDLDLTHLRIVPPKTKAYGHLAVKEKVPRFRDFIDRLDKETKRRIEKIGYPL